MTPIRTRPTVLRSALARLPLLLALAWVLALAACTQLPLPKSSPALVEPLQEQNDADLAAEADGFWKAGNAPLSELLYSRLLERDLDRETKLMALDRLAQSAYRAKHHHQAKQALDRRAGLDRSALGAWPWHELYLKNLAGMNRADLLDTHQAWLMAHTELPFEVRARGAVAFAELQAGPGEAQRALANLADLHRQAPGAAERTLLEDVYAASLRELAEERLALLVRQVGPGQSRFFPQALILREAARRGLAARAERPTLAAAPAIQAAPAAAQAPTQAAVPAPGPLLAQNATKARSDQPALTLLPRDASTVRVALVLPLTGRFGPTGQKVLRGAGAAQKKLADMGRKLELKVINADAPDWRAQLAALPPDYACVGGPLLNAEALRGLEADGALVKRAVFAFQADLGPTVIEGRHAWRFYPSLKDQARALLDLTADQLGVRSVAVLAPKNRYGQRMAEVFQAEAKAKGLRVAASETYPPDDHPRWTNAVGRLLKVPDGFRRNKNVPLPIPDFGAVFLPEDWTQAEMLASSFRFYEAEQLLFLGPDLWSVGLDNTHDVDDSNFQHAACPGAWWPETSGARALQAVLDAQNLGPADFWVALGYDFVRLAARLGLGGDWTAAEVDMRLAAVKDLDYSMAPLSWSAEGVARQNLYLFSPRKDGKALVDAPALRESLQKAKDRRERRLKQSREMQNTRQGGSGSLTRDVRDN